MLLRRYIFLFLVLVVPAVGFSQSPFNGMIIEEVEIHPDTAALIQAQAGFSIPPRTWRFYACLNDSLWELQSIFGYVVDTASFPFELDPGTGTFFQSPFGDVSGMRDDNLGLENFFPWHKYDSWFTIGNKPNPQLSQIFPGNELSNDFEGGNGFLLNDSVGGNIYTIASPPDGLPDLEARVLVGQFTLEGIFTGVLNFSFRKLNPDYSAYDPPGDDNYLIDVVGGVVIDNTPGVMDTICSIHFLPIDLVQFNAVAADKQVNLNWETRSEQNNDYFTIERSSNLQDWVEVAELSGAGTSSLTHFYHTIDRAPLLGTNYYRLKQTDYNGASETFEVKSVYFKGGQTLQLYPNPASKTVQILGSLEDFKQLNILNAYGGRVQYVERNFLSNQLNIEDLNSGIYFLEFTRLSGLTETHRLVIQR